MACGGLYIRRQWARQGGGGGGGRVWYLDLPWDIPSYKNNITGGYTIKTNH